MKQHKCYKRLYRVYNYSENYDFRNSCVSLKHFFSITLLILLHIKISQRIHVDDVVI